MVPPRMFCSSGKSKKLSQFVDVVREKLERINQVSANTAGSSNVGNVRKHQPFLENRTSRVNYSVLNFMHQPKTKGGWFLNSLIYWDVCTAIFVDFF